MAFKTHGVQGWQEKGLDVSLREDVEEVESRKAKDFRHHWAGRCSSSASGTVSASAKHPNHSQRPVNCASVACQVPDAAVWACDLKQETKMSCGHSWSLVLTEPLWHCKEGTTLPFLSGRT